jgi:signal transduction histidine kinase
MSRSASICLYRFVQEALTNAVKHSCAKGVRVTLRHDAEAIMVSVEDDGLGFGGEGLANTRDPKLGLGLLGMQERLAAVGGWLEISSGRGLGTRLVASIPLPPSETGEETP